MTDVQLTALLELLKKAGVKSYKGPCGETHPIELEFWDSSSSTSQEEAEASVEELDMCRCGHAQHMHTNGLCLAACDMEDCVDPLRPDEVEQQ